MKYTSSRFGPGGRFELQPAERRLLVDGEPVALGGRALDLLIALAARPDRLLTKGELLDRVWPGLVVEEANLQVQISNLRKLLGNDSIATVPGRGYRFAMPIDRDEPAGASAAVPAARIVTNLPAEPEPLYGRDDEVALVGQLVAAHRLVTLTGAGGIGKTRVAQAVARTRLDRHADGVWLIELAPLADPGLLPSAVAQALGLQLRSQRPPIDELVAALQPQKLLLLLDNCEHVLEATGALAQALLARTPDVRLLVTSQESLRLPGEQQVRLGTLAVPPAELLDADAALGFGAVRLFVERVRALDPRFRLDASNTAAIADICRHLDGLALAVELAAARVTSLGVHGVRDRLGERLRLLTAGSRIALRRHQTLRAALDWSHGLLSADERAVFRRLGVFSGGCTVEAAQQVASDGPAHGRSEAGPAPSAGSERSEAPSGTTGLDEWAVLDHLGTLIDKSLIVADGNDRPRYRLLESARAYALEKLAEAGETQALARRHARFYAAHFERSADALFAGATAEDGFIAARAVELDNLRAALGWALGDGGDTDIALALLEHNAPFCFLMPSFEECARWVVALERRAREAGAPGDRSALHDAVQMAWNVQGLRLGDAHSRPLPSIEALKVVGATPRQAYALLLRSLHATWRGDRATAQAALDAYDRLDARALPLWMGAYRLHHEIRSAYLGDDAPARRSELERLHARLQSAGDADGRAAFLVRTHLAEDSLLGERFDEAAERLGALAELGRRQRRDAIRMCFVLGPLVAALTECGRLDDALAVAREALPLLRQTGMRSEYAPALALLAARRGHADVAARLLGASDAHLARSGGTRGLLERRVHARAVALLQAAPAQLAEWAVRGASVSDEEFAQLVAQMR